MSLFPAYTEKAETVDEKQDSSTDQTWLQNASYKNTVHENTNENNDEIAKKPRRNKKRDKKVKKKTEPEELAHGINQDIPPIDLNNSPRSKNFYEDRKGEVLQLLIPTLMRGDAPSYEKPVKEKRFHKKDKIINRRYFQMNDNDFGNVAINYNEEECSEDIMLMPTTNYDDDATSSTKSEDTLIQTTKSFNQKLNEEPNNVQLWIDYIKFQDQVHKFEKNHRSGVDGSSTVTIERKLSILDKALSLNAKSEELVKMKYEIMIESLPFDKVHEQLSVDVKKDPGNNIIWKYVIEAVQGNLSRCDAPSVVSTLGKAMSSINKARYPQADLHLLHILLKTGLFLRQTSLWEQLCMLVRMYMQMMTRSQDIDVYESMIPSIDEIEEIEDTVLQSGLPMNALWQRLERLRQKVYWTPISDETCKDPGRVVLPSDMTDLITPIVNQKLDLDFCVVILTLLKVPLLPLRESSYKLLNLYEIPWFLDTAEMLLAAYYPIGMVQGKRENEECSLLSTIKELVSSPQYVMKDIGQEEYLKYIRETFKTITQCCTQSSETAVLIWWLRFERLLLSLGIQEKEDKGKTIKTLVKDLLKKPKHRSNVLLYVKYALIQLELDGNNTNCVNILQTTLSAQYAASSSSNNVQMTAEIASLYRNFAQVLLKNNEKEKCMKLLISLAHGAKIENISINDVIIQVTMEKYEKVTKDCLNNENWKRKLSLNDTMQPSFTLEWIHCHCLFLYLFKDIEVSVQFIKSIQQLLRSQMESNTIGFFCGEVLSEILVSIVEFHYVNTKSSYRLLQDSLHESLVKFPNNAYFLFTFSSLESRFGCASQWWVINRVLYNNESVIAKIFMILIARRRHLEYEKAKVQSHLILGKGGPVTEEQSGRFRMKNLLYKLSSNPVMKKCPLFWIIYMQFSAKFESEQNCKDRFHNAIENCPWVKGLYMEGAHMLPGELSQIQELIIEKELRLHITPEEIDILRDV